MYRLMIYYFIQYSSELNNKVFFFLKTVFIFIISQYSLSALGNGNVLGYASDWDCFADQYQGQDWVCRITQKQTYQISLDTISTQRVYINDTLSSLRNKHQNTNNIQEQPQSNYSFTPTYSTISENIPELESELDRLVYLLEKKGAFYTTLWFDGPDKAKATEVINKLKFVEAPLMLMIMEPEQSRYIVVAGIFSDKTLLGEHLSRSVLAPLVRQLEPEPFSLDQLKASVLSLP